MAVAIAAQLAGDTTMALYDFGGGEIPFPSPADLAYLCFWCWLKPLPKEARAPCRC